MSYHLFHVTHSSRFKLAEIAIAVRNVWTVGRREGTWVPTGGGCYGRDHFSARLALPTLVMYRLASDA